MSDGFIKAEIAIGKCRRLLLNLAPSLVKGVVSLIELDFVIFLTLAKHHQLFVFSFFIVVMDQPFFFLNSFASITNLFTMFIVHFKGLLEPRLMLLINEVEPAGCLLATRARPICFQLVSLRFSAKLGRSFYVRFALGHDAIDAFQLLLLLHLFYEIALTEALRRVCSLNRLGRRWDKISARSCLLHFVIRGGQILFLSYRHGCGAARDNRALLHDDLAVATYLCLPFETLL